MGSVEANGLPKVLINVGAKNVCLTNTFAFCSLTQSQVPFYTPIQDPPAGTPWDVQPEGSLFSPLKLRGLTLHNRIIVSPMCQYVTPHIPPRTVQLIL
jgi:hypothetical protein